MTAVASLAAAISPANRNFSSAVIQFLLTISKSQESEAMRSNESFGRNTAFATGSRGFDPNF
jgi:hypothetical protein